MKDHEHHINFLSEKYSHRFVLAAGERILTLGKLKVSTNCRHKTEQSRANSSCHFGLKEWDYNMLPGLEDPRLSCPNAEGPANPLMALLRMFQVAKSRGLNQVMKWARLFC